MALHIHILGASGSGTSTLGRALAESLGIRHIDTDDVYWAPGDVPYTVKRPVADRLLMLEAEFAAHDDWVLSGSLCSWGDSLVPRFTHVVFLYVPWDERSRRLNARELQRYGADAVAPGGEMHAVHAAFLEWASRYDEAGLEQRSYATHDRWLGGLPEACRVLRVEEAMPVDTLVQLVREII